MESWITVVVAAIVAISTLGGSFLQSWLSNKRFKIELGRAIDVESRKRRWEVRSEPLLKLRAELASMATKLHTLVENTRFERYKLAIDKNEQQRALEDYQNYITSGEFLPKLYIQFDKELLNLFENIESDYLLLFEYALKYKELREKDLKIFRDTYEGVKNKILEIQELINKKLEEL